MWARFGWSRWERSRCCNWTLALAPPMIDLLLGGEGKPGAVRELTDIEESILTSVVDVICRELSSAWQPVGLSFNFEKRQMQTQIARIMPVTEKTLCLSFEIRMPDASGLLELRFSSGGIKYHPAAVDRRLGTTAATCARDAGADSRPGRPHLLWRGAAAGLGADSGTAAAKPGGGRHRETARGVQSPQRIAGGGRSVV